MNYLKTFFVVFSFVLTASVASASLDNSIDIGGTPDPDNSISFEVVTTRGTFNFGYLMLSKEKVSRVQVWINNGLGEGGVPLEAKALDIFNSGGKKIANFVIPLSQQTEFDFILSTVSESCPVKFVLDRSLNKLNVSSTCDILE